MKQGIFLVLGCFGLIGSVLAAEEPAKTTGKPKIKFDQTVYDFGKTSQVEKVSGTFTFQNVGDAPLKMGKPTTTCGCTVAGVKPEVLQPGEKGQLDFSLSLGRTRQIIQKNIIVESNDPDSPKTTLTVKADYTPLYQIAPISFYTNIRKGETTNLTATVSRSDGKPFTVAKIKPSQSWIEAKAEPVPNSTNHAVQIKATLKPEGSPRYFKEKALTRQQKDGYEYISISSEDIQDIADNETRHLSEF
jgi:hypothetical protein